MRISSSAKYTEDFTPPAQRHRPEADTLLLLHFDEATTSSIVSDTQATTSAYLFSRATGTVRKNISKLATMSVFDLGTFINYPDSVRVTYKAGYDLADVPNDLKLATMDLAKILYKQDQDKQSFTFEGESGDKAPLSSNFPAHVRRILDLYRII